MMMLMFIVALLGEPATKPLACNLGALTPAERAHHKELTQQLGAAVRGQAPLPAGYALKLDRGKVSLAQLAEWTELESRCCPFLTFNLELSDSALTLSLTGGEGVKDFVKAELAGVVGR